MRKYIAMLTNQIPLLEGHINDTNFIRSASIGDILYFQKILLTKKNKFFQIGAPWLQNTRPIGIFLATFKSKKIVILKTKPKKKYTRQQGAVNCIGRFKLFHSMAHVTNKVKNKFLPVIYN